MEISIIIVNYKTAQLTSNCIESIQTHTAKSDYEIIVVDNASGDGSADYIQERFPDVKVICSETNIGFGRANNLGSKSANGKFLFFLNSDTVFLNDVLNHFLFKYSQLENDRKNPGVIGTLMVNDQLQVNSSYGYFQSPWEEILSITKHMLKRIDLEKKFTEKHGTFEVDWVTGADMFMKKSLFQETGGFDSKFFMYHEEVDLQKRINEKGYRNYIVEGPSIIHLEGASSSKKFSNRKRMLVDESRFIYYRKHTTPIEYFAYRALYLLVRSPSLFNRGYTSKENREYLRALLNKAK